MRITNKDYTPIEVFAELATRRGVTTKDTQRYFDGERSSHDWVVVEWADRVDCVLDSFCRYGIDVSPTQFIRDHGIDVLFRDASEGNEGRRLGFQIKSNQEANREAKRKKDSESMIAVLKRQAFEAFERVDEWWIVCCFDMVTHHSLIQRITSELAAGKHAKQIRVLDARAAMAVLKMSEAEIDAFCTLLLCKDDEVLKTARREALELDPTAARFVLSRLPKALIGEHTTNREDVWEQLFSIRDGIVGEAEDQLDTQSHDADEQDSNTHEIFYDDDGKGTGDELLGPPEDVSEALSALEGIGFLQPDTFSDRYACKPAVFPGLCALFFEARVRHELDESASGEYVKRLVTGD